ncbi:MAG: T9SS type A sorting domain-containing protein, partial [Saprospiraceae bacterium]
QDVQKNDKKGFEVFPNPANETITIDIPDAQNTDQSEILIFDMNGKLQLRQIVTKNALILDISQFQSGFYTISWAKDGKIQSSRYFIKTKI